jgi:ribosome-binding protein aMBF1 (putative translation factor)
MTSKDFGKIIRRHRKYQGWTALDLAIRLDVCEHTIYKWEYGVYRPNELNFALLIHALDICNVRLEDITKEVTE